MTPHEQIRKLLGQSKMTCSQVARHLQRPLEDTRAYLEDMRRWGDLKYNVEGCTYEIKTVA